MSSNWNAVVGQQKAVAQLQASVDNPVHAYLFVGPSGSGKHQAARIFASSLLGDERALIDAHPDVVTVEREGASINVAQAREISRLAARTPGEGQRKVLILTEFHLVNEAAPALLKTIEEASASTIFIVLAESITNELVTVASRCVVVQFNAIPESLIVSTLVDEGIDEERAKQVATSAMGSLDRARLLAADDGAADRHALWAASLARLDGHGATAAQVAIEVAGAIDLATTPLLDRQQTEVAALEARVKEGLQTAGSLKVLETRHKREQRRLRTDELRAGFATLAQELPPRMQRATDVAAVKKINDAQETLRWANASLEFNPNESLLLQSLFVRLSELSSATLV